MIQENIRQKALNSKDEEIFNQYSKIEAVENQDENNNLWYENNILKVQKIINGELLIIKEKEIVPVEYDSISALKGIKMHY